MQNNRQLNVYGYTRVSSREQSETGLSLQTQEEQIQAFCASRNWTLLRIFSDVASGADEKRRGLKSLLAGVTKDIYAVVVTRADRLGRLKYWDHIDRRLEKHKVALVSIQEGFDVTTPAGRAARDMLRVFARFERELVGERTREVIQRKKKAHEHYGPTPYGYRVEGTSLVPDEAELKWVRRMRRRKQEMRWSYADIAAWMNKKGVPRKKGGKQWYASTVLSILTNPIHKRRRRQPA